MLTDFIEILNYSFFRHALLAAILISVAGGIIGTYIVSRRLVFLSGGISHASFGGVGLAWYFGFNPIVGAAIFAIISALSIDQISRHQKIRMDSSIGILWSIGMAIGIIFVFLTPGYSPNLMSFLFGNILTVSTLDLWLLTSLTIILAAFFIFYYRIILYIAYDETHAFSHKVPVQVFSLILLCLLALTIVFAIKIVGIILIVAMLTIPQAAANLLSKNFKSIIFYSILLGAIGAIAGLIFSYSFNIPSGAAIIFSQGILFLILKISIYLFNR